MSLTVEKCLQAWNNSLRQMNAKADIVFFGDSLTYYGDFASVFPDKVVCNLGLRGDTIQGMIERVEQVLLLQPKQVFLMAGINDVATCSPNLFEEKYSTLIQKLQEIIQGAEITIQSILPVNEIDYSISCTNLQIIKCNTIIERIAEGKKLHYFDLYSLYTTNDNVLPKNKTIDGIHLFPDAYMLWYDILKTNSYKWQNKV